MSTTPAAYAALQSRQNLESAKAQKEHRARVKQAFEPIWNVRFNGKIFKPTQAAIVEILRMCGEYHGVSPSLVVPSTQTLQEIYLRQRQYWNQTFHPEMFIKPEDARRDAIFEIMLALKCGRPSITNEELTAEKYRLQYFTLAALRNRLNVILQSQRLCGKSAEQLRAELEQQRAENAPLPDQIPAEYTPEVLKQKLREWSREVTERFIARYGLDAVNSRLQGKG